MKDLAGHLGAAADAASAQPPPTSADSAHGPATPASLVARTGRPPPRRLPDWSLTLPPLLTLAVMLWGISAPSYWRDEADTISAVSRSLPQLFRLLGHVDAVHGLYYLLLWPVTKLMGTRELVTRLPSAAAMTAAAFGIAVLARRLESRRAAVCAGLVFAAIPMVTAQGHDARPYAMVTAAGVLASYLLVRAVADPRPRWLACYGLSLTLLGYLHLFALLLVPAHAITLIGLAGRRGVRERPPGPPNARSGGSARALIRRWLITVTAAGLTLAPLVALGWLQRGQISWIGRPGWPKAGQLALMLTGGTAASAALLVLLMTLGASRARLPGQARRASPAEGGRRRLAWLALPWLVLPPITLFAMSEIKPIYYDLYLTFCLSAVALLAGAGLARLATPLRLAAATAMVVIALPAQLAMRTPGSGGSIRAAQVLSHNERPGDAVIYPGSGVPPWYLAYPQGFGQLRDIFEAKSGPAAGRLYGLRVPLRVLFHRERGVRRVWAIEIGPYWRSPAPYLMPGFRLTRMWDPRSGALKLWLYQQDPAGSRPGDARGASL